jgi:hypothetical protein
MRCQPGEYVQQLKTNQLKKYRLRKLDTGAYWISGLLQLDNELLLNGHATGFIRTPSLQRLEVKLAECSRGVITNKSPCDAYDGNLRFDPWKETVNANT